MAAVIYGCRSVWTKFLDLRNVCAKTCKVSPVGLSEYTEVLAYNEVVTRDKVYFNVALAHLPASFEPFAGTLKGYNQTCYGVSYHDFHVSLVN